MNLTRTQRVLTLCLFLFVSVSNSACSSKTANGNNDDNAQNNVTNNNEEVDAGPKALTCEPLENRRCECEFGTGEQTCTTGGGEWNACVCPIQDIESREGAVEIRPALPGSALVQDQTLILPLRGNGEYKDLEPGTIVYLLEGQGLAGRVIAAAATDDQIVITTEQVEIDEVFAKLEISIDEVPIDIDSYSPEAMKALLGMGTSAPNALWWDGEDFTRGITYDAGHWSLRLSGNPTYDLKFLPGSTGHFRPTLDTDLEISWPLFEEPQLSHFHFDIGLDAGFLFKPQLTVAGSGLVSLETELIQLAQKLAGHPHPQPAEVHVGAGFSVEVTLNLRCQIGVEGEAVLATEFGLGIDANGGIEYNGGSWDVIGNVDVRAPVGSVTQPDWAGSVFMRCELKPRVRLRFLQFAYGFVEAGPYIKATQDFGGRYMFNTVGGFNGVAAVGAEVDAEAVVITLIEETFNLFDYRWNLYSREFAKCGDGYRQKDSVQVLGGEMVVEYREECDSGGHDDRYSALCDDSCECVPGTAPHQGASEYIDHPEVDPYNWKHGFFDGYNRCVSTCGDGVVDENEFCDNGACVAMGQLGCPGVDTCGPDGCSADCTRRVGICGDGIVDSHCYDTDSGESKYELCDDGDTPGTPEDKCDSCVSCRFDESCGNGRIDPLCETCDHGGTPDEFCDAACVSQYGFCGDNIINLRQDGTLEECDDGNSDACDGCNPDCTIETDTCGDGWTCGDEECDNFFDPGADTWECDSGFDCTFRVCGDGYVNTAGPNPEECDEVSAACDPDCTFTVCGDFVVNPLVEECDKGGVDQPGCLADCTVGLVCGDGVVDPGEVCDDGDNSNCTRACRSDCQGPVKEPVCGDGFVDSFLACPDDEACDDGAMNGECGYCSDDCMTAPTNVCGDGVKSACEACDDGNTIGGDGCSANCTKIEVCGDAWVDEGEVCDSGPNLCDGDCLADCSDYRGDVCGDGIVSSPCEVCENTNTGNTGIDQGCTSANPNCNGCAGCSSDVCGDGIIGASETCDPGGICSEGTEYCTIYDVSNCGAGQYCFFNEFECAGSCTRVVTCGDGYRDGAEACDDGNTMNGDGCSDICDWE